MNATLTPADQQQDAALMSANDNLLIAAKYREMASNEVNRYWRGFYLNEAERADRCAKADMARAAVVNQ